MNIIIIIIIKVNRTGSPQGLSQVQISHKVNTIYLFIEGLYSPSTAQGPLRACH